MEKWKVENSKLTKTWLFLFSLKARSDLKLSLHLAF